MAQALHNRGAGTLDQARDFLQPRMDALHDPRLMPNIEAAARRLALAVRNRQHVTLYGDYDVDGMTGLAVLRSVLSAAGASVDCYVPHRLEEGYGVNEEAVKKILAGPTKLLVTVDCGISGTGPLAAATVAGVDVIVTDHHQLPEELPKALAIVHPCFRAVDTPTHISAAPAWHSSWPGRRRELCGRDRLDAPMGELLLEGMCLAALGIIADVVPLVGENRIFAAYGLKALPATKHIGLRALIDCTGLAGQSLDAYHVGFVLAPRLNACGRMGHAALAVELPDDRAAAAERADRPVSQRPERQAPGGRACNDRSGGGDGARSRHGRRRLPRDRPGRRRLARGRDRDRRLAAGRAVPPADRAGLAGGRGRTGQRAVRRRL